MSNELRCGDLADFVLRHGEHSAAVVLSGATGFIGGEFLFWALQLGSSASVLARPKSISPRARVVRRLREAAICNRFALPTCATRARLQVVNADLMLPDCGVDSQDVKRLRCARPTAFWHFANTGAESVIEAPRLAASIGARRFIHVSNAWAPFCAAEGTSIYYVDKRLQEQAVESSCRELGLDYSIVRPSFVVGKTISRVRHSFGLPELFRSLEHWTPPTGVPAESDPRALNIVAVAAVVHAMMRLHTGVMPWGPRLDICSSQNISFAEAIRCIRGAACEIHARTIEDEAPARNGGDRFHRWTQEHAFSLGFDVASSSDCTNPSPRSADLWNHAADWFAWTEIHRRGITSRLVRAPESHRKTVVYLSGPRQSTPLFLINAYHNPVEVFFPLLRRLATHFRVITWETHALPQIGATPHPAVTDSSEQVRLFGKIRRRLGIRSASVVGWCSGTQIALRILARYPRHVKRAVLLNNGLPLCVSDDSYTDYVGQLQTMFSTISDDPEMAAIIHDMFYGSGADGLDEEICGTFATLPRYLRYLISTPFRTPAILYEYALVSAAYWREASSNPELLPRVRAPVLLYTGGQDVVARPATSADIHRSLPGSHLYHDETATHFEHFLDSSKIAGLIGTYLSSDH